MTTWALTSLGYWARGGSSQWTKPLIGQDNKIVSDCHGPYIPLIDHDSWFKAAYWILDGHAFTLVSSLQSRRTLFILNNTIRKEQLIVDISGAQRAFKPLWKALALPQPLQRGIVDFQGMPVAPKNSLIHLIRNFSWWMAGHFLSGCALSEILRV